MGDEFFGFAGHFGAERGALDDTDIGNFGGVEGFIGAGFFEAGLHVFEAGFFGIFFAFEFGDLGADEGDAGGLFLGGGELRFEGIDFGLGGKELGFFEEEIGGSRGIGGGGGERGEKGGELFFEVTDLEIEAFDFAFCGSDHLTFWGIFGEEFEEGHAELGDLGDEGFVFLDFGGIGGGRLRGLGSGGGRIGDWGSDGGGGFDGFESSGLDGEFGFGEEEILFGLGQAGVDVGGAFGD